MANSKPVRITFRERGLLILLVANALLLAAYTWSTNQTRQLDASPTPTFENTGPVTETAEADTATPSPSPTATFPPVDLTNTEYTGPFSSGLIIASIYEDGYAQLFAFRPQPSPFLRLTHNPWDTLSPAISPDGTRLAFASRKNGYFDLYVMDLGTGSTTQLTDTGEYDGAPSWSPDGQWLAYETYQNNNLEIYVRSVVDLSQPPIALTDDPAPDYAPSWSSQGREIAFVSARSGEPEIWTANLDRADDRYRNISQSPETAESRPVWAPDGARLAYVSCMGGVSEVYVWNTAQPDTRPARAGSGSWPAWNPAGDLLLTGLELPNQSYLAAFHPGKDDLALPPVPLTGRLQGLDWKNAALPSPLPAEMAAASSASRPILWIPALTPIAEGPQNRESVVEMADVTAPHPYLHDAVDEAFAALRARLGSELGWDYLASLENAFVPLTSPQPPGLQDDWLLTGRSFSTNPVPMNAGWMAVVREDYSGQAYWRVYLRARFQDGSQGRPIAGQAWDMDARFTGDPVAYEQGGRLSPLAPTGYFIDLTEWARAYGWERLPSLPNWPTYYAGMRFNQFVMTGGLDWQSSMLALYPREALYTATPYQSPTPTSTATFYWMKVRTPTPSRTPSPTPTQTITPTRRPTWTPMP